MHVCLPEALYMCLYVLMHMCVHVFMCAYIYIWMCVHVCMTMWACALTQMYRYNIHAHTYVHARYAHTHTAHSSSPNEMHLQRFLSLQAVLSTLYQMNLEYSQKLKIFHVYKI